MNIRVRIAFLALCILLIPNASRAQAGSGTEMIETWWNMEGTQRAISLLYATEQQSTGGAPALGGYGMEIRQAYKYWTITLRGILQDTPTDKGSEVNTSVGVEFIPLQYKRVAIGVNGHFGRSNVSQVEGLQSGLEYGYGASAYLLLASHFGVGSTYNQTKYDSWGKRRQLLFRAIFFY